MGYILSIDQGTTGTTALLIDEKSLNIIAKSNHEFSQYFPSPGYVEHDLNEIWESVKKSIQSVLEESKIKKENIVSIGITNQRETICPFNKDGEPLHKAIVWQDRRTHNFCTNNKNKEEWIFKKTGLTLDPYFSATKMAWLLKNNPSIKDANKKKNLNLGTIDTFLIYKLTQGQSYFTEATNASRTLLMNLETGQWDKELCDFFDIDSEILPEIKNSFDDFGKTKGLDFLPDNIPIHCVLGDQQSALFGQGGAQKGDIKCTYGTGAFILLNTGEKASFSKSGLLTTVAYKKDGKIFYALEGSSYIAGAAVQWLRDNLKIIKSSPDIEPLARKVKNLEEVKNILFLPFFTGIGSPHWKSDATCSLVGLTRGADQSHIARACLEGIALSINDIIKVMKKDSNINLKKINVDGGACANDLLCEIQASLSSVEILRPTIIETTSFGVALGCLIYLKKITIEDIKENWSLEKSFTPKESLSSYFKEKTTLWSEYIKKIYFS